MIVSTKYQQLELAALFRDLDLRARAPSLFDTSGRGNLGTKQTTAHTYRVDIAASIEVMKIIIPMQHPMMSGLLWTGPPSQSPGPHPVPPPLMAT